MPSNRAILSDITQYGLDTAHPYSAITAASGRLKATPGTPGAPAPQRPVAEEPSPVVVVEELRLDEAPAAPAPEPIVEEPIVPDPVEVPPEAQQVQPDPVPQRIEPPPVKRAGKKQRDKKVADVDVGSGE